MKRIGFECVAVLAAGFYVFSWLVATFRIAGLWLGCDPSLSNYPCTSHDVALRQTLLILAVVALINLLGWVAARRFGHRR